MRHLITILTSLLLLAWVSYVSWPTVAEVKPRGLPREVRESNRPMPTPHSVPISVDDAGAGGDLL